MALAWSNQQAAKNELANADIGPVKSRMKISLPNKRLKRVFCTDLATSGVYLE